MKIRSGRFVAAALISAVALAYPATAGAVTTTATVGTFVRTLGGPGHASMYPSGMEIAPDGSVVVADTGNDRILKYTSGGSLLWAVGKYGPSGVVGTFDNPRDVGVDSKGYIYVADDAHKRVVKLSPSGAWMISWTGPSTDPMGPPIGISVTGDKVYVADADAAKRKVRVFDTNGNQIRAFGPQGVCDFNAFRDVDADSAGNVYLANYKSNNILKMSATGTCLMKWGTPGTGNGQFKNPYGVRIRRDPVLGKEAVYVADSNNNRIQEFTTGGAFVAKAGVTGTGTGQFAGLRRVAVAADGDVWGADLWGYKVSRFNRTSSGYAYAQTIGGVPPPLTSTRLFNEVRGIAFDSSGLWAVDTVNQRIVHMSLTGGNLKACGQRGWLAGAFNWPKGVAVDKATGQIWVADTKQYRLQILKPDCSVVSTLGSQGSELSKFLRPSSIAIRPSDRIAFVADTQNHRVVSYDVATRKPIAAFGSFGTGLGQFNYPRGIAVDPANGHILVADSDNNRIVELSENRGSGFSVVRTTTAGNSLRAPEGVAADSAGRIYVADTGNSRAVVLQPTGAFLGTLPGSFDLPQNVAVDPSNKIYVADTYNDRIQVYSYP